ncbi:MAG: hypothetical protein P4L85_26520 [Paludisphaera borealis]|uniref:hypothetical protein n=1 Tax=Paludisphaera borealis TaxID=1387353 RepID=UPI00283C385B|nr:hypothetical protein [Paludisphaera borealis]MDR3622937.1 hypothetical protein [Paludisphaera borealis]
MKKSLRLAFGLGVITASLGLMGCDGGSSDEGLPTNTKSSSTVTPEQLNAVGGNMAPPKKAPAKIGTDQPKPADAK